MKPQARIKARLVEEAGAAGVRLSVTARRSARLAIAGSPESKLFYVTVFGEWDDDVKFRRSAHLDIALTSGGPGDRTYSLPPDVIRKVLEQTELDPAWLAWNGSAALNIARRIGEEHSFDQLPVLADTLEEAGCTNTFILEHCRAAAPHDTACWVVELLLGAAGAKHRRST